LVSQLRHLPYQRRRPLFIDSRARNHFGLPVIRQDDLPDPQFGWQFSAVDKLRRRITWPAPQFTHQEAIAAAPFDGAAEAIERCMDDDMATTDP
jgi:hypothetical protein